MASSVVADKKEIEVREKGNKMETLENKEEVVSVELPAPYGWMKKFIPKKSGTPKRNEIVFISPTGEEIKSKKQLDMFLKAHPGSPPSSEFDWSTGDTPRRSARISEKSKATETPEPEPAKKRERKSSSKKGAKEGTDDGEDGASKEDQAAAVAEELKEGTDIEMKEAEDGGDKIAEQVHTGEVPEVQKGAKVEKDTESAEKPEEANNKNETDPKAGQAENNSLPPETAEEEKKSEVPPPLSGSNEVPSAEKEVKVADEASAKKVNESLPDDSSNHKEGQEESNPQETRPVSCEEAQHQPKASPVSC